MIANQIVNDGGIYYSLLFLNLQKTFTIKIVDS